MPKISKTDVTAKKFNDLPHSVEAEQALLGCLILDTKIQTEVAAFLHEEDFYAEYHKYIFSAIETLIKNNITVDFVTLTDCLEKSGTLESAGGVSYITELANVLPSSAGYQMYLDMVLRDSMLRKLIDGATKIIEESKTSADEKKSLSFAEKTVFEISNTADTSEVVKIGNIIPDVMTRLDELANNKEGVSGIKTGYRGLDDIINGLHQSALLILAARPAVGKTSFAMNIAEHVALSGRSCAVFSLEMGKEELGQRILCSVAEVSMENASKGRMNREEWLKIERARKKLSDARIFIDDSTLITPREIISKCRRLKRKFGLDFIVIDYVQLMTPDLKKNLDNRQQEITDISRNLKILAKEVKVPVLALSQLSRAVEAEKRRPQLSDLRESGAIEQDADVVMFIHRPDQKATEQEIQEGKVQRNVAEIIVAKNRSGRTGTVKLYFKGEITKFLNINEETGEPEEVKDKQNKRTEVEGYEDLPPVGEEPNGIDEPLPDEPPVKSVDDEIY